MSSEEQWVELRVVHDESEAEVIRTLLEAQDIPVVLRSNLTRSIYPSLSQIRIFVPKDSLQAALELLEESELERPL